MVCGKLGRIDIANRRQWGDRAADYSGHPSNWYAAVSDRSWIGSQMVVVNSSTWRYVLAGVVEVSTAAGLLVNLSPAAFEELGAPRWQGVHTAWAFRI